MKAFSDDTALIKAIIEKDDKGYNQLYHSYYSIISSFLRNRGAKKEDIETLYHETLLVFEKIVNKSEFELEHSIRALLKGIAWKVFLKWINKNPTHYPITEDLLDSLSDDNQSSINQDVRLQVIEEELANYESYVRLVFYYRYFSMPTHSFKEIATILFDHLSDEQEITRKANAIRQKHFQVIEKIKVSIGDHYIGRN